ncbi:30S ribosomal protein S11 [Candidatus Falkowbacteria bacterium]|nr:30S ribosomal protein S11 [Candidatus Falkowbacteria bacterium]
MPEDNKKIEEKGPSIQLGTGEKEAKDKDLDKVLDSRNKEDPSIQLRAGKDEEKDAKKSNKKIKKNKVLKLIKKGQAYVKATYNNTIITLTDQNGNVLSWASAGKCGFKGPKKSTPYAAGVVVRDACEKAMEERGLREVNVFVKGVGASREAAIRALQINGLTVLSIKDVTPTPHNGCRPKKVRRV